MSLCQNVNRQPCVHDCADASAYAAAGFAYLEHILILALQFANASLRLLTQLLQLVYREVLDGFGTCWMLTGWKWSLGLCIPRHGRSTTAARRIGETWANAGILRRSSFWDEGMGLLSTDMSAPPAYFPAPVVKPISSSPNLEFGQEKLEVLWSFHRNEGMILPPQGIKRCIHKVQKDGQMTIPWFQKQRLNFEDGPITARHVKTLSGKIPSLECYPTEPATCVVERSMKSLVDCLCLEFFSTGEKTHLKLNCHIREMGPQYHWKQYFAYRKYSKNDVLWFEPIWILAKVSLL